MGIRFLCPNGHKLNVKAFQAGRRGICPYCGAKFQIPTESTIQPGQSAPGTPEVAPAPVTASSDVATFEQDLDAHIQQAQPNPSEQPAWSPHAASSPSSVASSEHSTEPVAPVEPEGEAPPEESASSDLPTETPSSSGESDPLVDAPNAVWYVRPPSGGQFGPAQADMMRGWLEEGRVSPETLVWREGWADWQEAGSVFPQLQPPAGREAPPVAGNGSSQTASLRTGTRRRRTGPNLGLIVVLVVAVLLLLVVLVAILVIGSIGASDGEGESAGPQTASFSNFGSLPSLDSALTPQSDPGTLCPPMTA